MNFGGIFSFRGLVVVGKKLFDQEIVVHAVLCQSLFVSD